MHVAVSQSQLDRALAVVGRAVAPRSTLPVTGHVLLATRPGKLRLAATNLDLAIVTLIDAEVKAEGSLSVPARTLADLVGSLPDGEVELSRKPVGCELIIRAPRFAANATGLEATEFPAIDAAEPTVLYRVHAGTLRQGIEGVLFAAARDQARPQLSSLLLRAKGDSLTLVGCDSFRLAVRRLSLPQPVADDTPDLIVPRGTMAEVARGFGGLNERVAVASTPTRSQVIFASDRLQLIARLIDGSYVDYERVMEQTASHDLAISANTAEIRQAARFSAIVARDDNNALRVAVTPGPPSSAPEDGAPTERTLVLQAAAQVGENTTERASSGRCHARGTTAPSASRLAPAGASAPA
jgi:DNA polymerase-3 subunit beta